MSLTPKDRHALDYAIPFGSRLSDGTHTAGALFFPKLALIGLSAMVTPGTGLTVNITGGFARDANGNVVEVPPQTNYGTLTAPASGHSRIYLICFDPAAKTFSTIAGATAVTGVEVAPTATVGLIAVATIDITFGDTTPGATKVSNIVRAGLR